MAMVSRKDSQDAQHFEPEDHIGKTQGPVSQEQESEPKFGAGEFVDCEKIT